MIKITIGVIAGFLLGFIVHSLLPSKPDLSRHWQIVQENRDYVLNPKNYTTDPKTGLSLYVTKPPDDPMPSLAALVAADELHYIDIVFPTVRRKNREATRCWIDYWDKHGGIYMSSNPSHSQFTTKGEQPLHLNIWFKDSAKSDVQQLIKTLEEMGTKEEPTTGRTVPPETGASGGQ